MFMSPMGRKPEICGEIQSYEAQARRDQEAFVIRAMNEASVVKELRDFILVRPKNPFSMHATEDLSAAIERAPLQHNDLPGVFVRDDDLIEMSAVIRIGIRREQGADLVLYVYSDNSCILGEFLPDPASGMVRACTLPLQIRTSRIRAKGEGWIKAKARTGTRYNTDPRIETVNHRSEETLIEAGPEGLYRGKGEDLATAFCRDLGREAEAIMAQMDREFVPYRLKDDLTPSEDEWLHMGPMLKKQASADHMAWLNRNVFFGDVHLPCASLTPAQIAAGLKVVETAVRIASARTGIETVRMAGHVYVEAGNPLAGSSYNMVIRLGYQELLCLGRGDDDKVKPDPEACRTLLSAAAATLLALTSNTDLWGFHFVYGAGKIGQWVPFTPWAVPLAEVSARPAEADLLQARFEKQLQAFFAA